MHSHYRNELIKEEALQHPLPQYTVQQP